MLPKLVFTSTVTEWNNLDNNLRNSGSFSAFKKNKILKSIKPVLNSAFNVHNPHGIKLLTRLRVGLSYLRELKFKHNFPDSLDSFHNRDWHIETTIHFFLRCSNYSNQRKTLFDKISNIKRFLLNQNAATIVGSFLSGANGLYEKENALIIESIIEYIIRERFIASLLWMHLSRSPRFLKSLIGSGLPYLIFFYFLVV